MHREQPRNLVEVDLKAEKGVVACRLDSLYDLRLVVSGGEGLGPDIVGRLRFFKNHVMMRVYGKRLIVSVVLDPNAVAGLRVLPHINVEVPAPPEVGGDYEGSPDWGQWFAAPSDLFDESEAIAEGPWLGARLPPAPFAIDANASVRYRFVSVDANELFKALTKGGNDGDEESAGTETEDNDEPSIGPRD